MSSRFFCLLWVCAGALFLTGCSRGRSPAQQLAKADEYYAAKKFEPAKLLYISVLRKDATQTNALVRLGKILFRQGQIEDAYPLLLEARRRAPEDLEVAEQLASAYVAAGKLPEARSQARAILAQQPTNEVAVGVLIQAAQSPASTSVDLEQATAELNALERRAGPHPMFHLARAMVASSRRDGKTAEAEIQRALVLDPRSVQANITLGMIRWTQGATNQAEAALRKAVALAPADHPAHFHLAGLLLRTGRISEAKKTIDQINRDAPERTSAWILRAEIAMQESQLEECGRFLDRALSQAPNDLTARLTLAHLRLAQKKPGEAVKILTREVERRTWSGEAVFQLGLAQLANKELVAAGKSFSRAESIDPKDFRPVLMRAEVNLSQGQPGSAITALLELTRRQPNLIPAQFLLGRAYITDGKYDLALTLFRTMNERIPRNPAILFRLGLLLAQRQAFTEARKAFSEAQEVAPEDLLLTEQLVELDLAENSPRAAADRLKPALERNPKAFRLWLLQAKIFSLEKRYDDTEQALETAIALEPGSPAAYMMLAQLKLRNGEPKDSLKRMRDLLVKNPKNLGARVLSGIIQEQTEAFEDAQKSYEEALKIEPESVLVLNNLAYLMAERLGRIEEAHAFATKAARLAPEDPRVADTLGWIEFRRGNYPEAFRLLSKAQEKLTLQPEVVAHLGLTSYMSGDENLARQALSDALKSNTQFSARDLAEQSLAILNIQGERTAESMIALLEKRRRDNPRDFVATLRLGIAYEATGQIDKAREAYEAAFRLSPASSEVARRLAAVEVERNPARALELARQAQRSAPEDGLVNQTLGRLALRAGDADTAYSLLAGSARQLTNRAEVWFELARAAFAGGRLPESEAAMRRTLTIGGVSGLTNSAVAWVRMLEVAASPTAEKLAPVQQVLKGDPTNGPALYALALVQAQKGEYATARDLHKQLLQQYPAFTRSVRELAILFSEHLGQDAEAFGFATRARAADSKDEALARSLAGLSFRRGDFRYAAQLFGELAKAHPKDGGLQFQLARCHLALKERPPARAALQRAVTLEPNGSFVAEAKQMLKDLGPG